MIKKVIFTIAASLLSTISGVSQTFYNVNIIDVEAGVVIPGKCVKIENGVFSKIFNSPKIIHGDYIDMKGMYMMPGLIDSHSHFANFIHNQVSADSLCAAAMREGITSFNDMGGDASKIKGYISSRDSNGVVGPRIFFCTFWGGEKYFKMVSIGGKSAVDTIWNVIYKPGITDISSKIKDAVNYGCTGIKLYNDIPFRDLVDISKEAKKRGLKVWAHFTIDPPMPHEVVKSGVESVSHAYLVTGKFSYNEASIADSISRKEIFSYMKKHNITFDPTLTLSVENGFNNDLEFFKESYRMGVEFVAGTDYIDISSNGSYTSFLVNELSIYVNRCGVSIADALRSATINGAKRLGMEGKLGLIKKGAFADFIILKENPLLSIEALKNPKMVYVNGKPASKQKSTFN